MFLKFNNWIHQWYMRRGARRIADWARSTFDELKNNNPDQDNNIIRQHMLFDEDKLNNLSDDLRKHIEICCQSIEGACYMGALEMGEFNKWMNFRCLQFTVYMDYELHNRGFKAQSLDAKKEILQELDLLFDGWEQWVTVSECK